MSNDKALERQLRQSCEILGMTLRKSRRRTASESDYGKYAIFDGFTGLAIYGCDEQTGRYAATLKECQMYLGKRARGSDL